MTAIPETFQDLFHKRRRFGWRNDATRAYPWTSWIRTTRIAIFRSVARWWLYPKRAPTTNIDKLTKKYLNLDSHPRRKPGEVRVIYKIEPEHAHAMG
jgi:hypothetical protein